MRRFSREVLQKAYTTIHTLHSAEDWKGKTETFREYWGPARDPRPDLVEDSDLWSRLLALAVEVNVDLAWTLNGFRCFGARLEDRGATVRIVAGDCEDYDALRDQWLLPYRRTLTALLQRVTEHAEKVR